MSIKYQPNNPEATPGYRVNTVSDPLFQSAYTNDTEVSPNGMKVTQTIEGQLEWFEATRALKAYRF